MTLLENPFYVLRASPSDGHDELAHRRDLRLFDAPENERQINAAFATLTNRMRRTSSEISWPLSWGAAAVQKVEELSKCSEARAGSIADALRENPERLLVNAFLATRFPAAARFRVTMLQALKEVNAGDFVDEMDAARDSARIPRPTLDETISAFNELINDLAQIYVGIITSSRTPSEVLVCDIVEVGLTNSPAHAATFWAQTGNLYERTIESDVGAREANLDRLLHLIREGDVKYITEFAAQLRAWDEICQPLQMLDAARGLRHSRSHKLYKDMRSAAIALANDKNLYSDALALSEIAAAVFKELPAVLNENDEDQESLRGLITQQELVDGRLRELFAFYSKYLDQTAKLAKIVTADTAEFKTFASEFVRQINQIDEPQVAELAFRLVRGLAIALNDADYYAAALKFMDGTVGGLSARKLQLASSMSRLRSTVVSNKYFTDISAAMKAGRPGEAKRLVSEVKETIPSAERGDEFESFLTTVEAAAEKQEQERLGNILWPIIILGALIALSRCQG